MTDELMHRRLWDSIVLSRRITCRSRRFLWGAIWRGCLAISAYFLLSGICLAAKNVTYYYTDSLGTVLMTTDAAGAQTGSGDVRPFGVQIGDIVIGNIRYASHVSDDADGLVYMSARYYDPAVGRFISADPIFPGLGDVFNFSRFAYANNNPIRNVDLTGATCGSAGEVSGGVQRMRDASDGCNRSTITGGEGTFLPISGPERSAAAQGNPALFWSLRYQEKPRDPWSDDGMALWNPSGMDSGLHSSWMKALAWVNLGRLNDAISLRDGTFFSSVSNESELKQIGVDVMRSYVKYTDRNGGFVPSLSQSAAFHYEVFQAHNLPAGIYGGTPFGYGPTGASRSWGDWQSNATNAIFNYCSPGCEP